MLRALSFVVLVTAVEAPSVAIAQSTEVCSIMVEADGAMRTETVEGYVVTGAPTPLRRPEGYANISALICNRSSLTIGDNDFRAPIDLGVPMYVQGDDRIVAIEIVGGRFRIRFVKGAPTEEEASRLQSALDRAQSLAQGGSQ